MNKQNVAFSIFAAVLIAVVVGVMVLREAVEGKRHFTTMMTYNVGKEPIAKTNSSFVAGIGPELHTQLSQLLASATDVARVRLGDEPPPVGDGRASSRVTLTNALAQGLGIRLQMGHDAAGQSRFNVLGYWTFSEPGGAANRGRQVGSQTDPTSGAVGSGR